MKKLRIEVTLDNKVVFSKEDVFCSVMFEAQRAMQQHIWPGWQEFDNLQEGQKGQKVGGIVRVSYECTMNRRRPKRAPDVIAAEKAQRDAKRQQAKLATEKWRQEAEQRRLNLRQRIKSQVDHAFAVGKSGTEPAAKYITCQHCDAPAVCLVLSRALTPGACVLDEDSIDGALCAEHSNYGISRAERVSCSRLEFLYDGVRQIAIKL